MNSKGKITFAILAVAIMIVASASVVTGNLANDADNNTDGLNAKSTGETKTSVSPYQVLFTALDGTTQIVNTYTVNGTTAYGGSSVQVTSLTLEIEWKQKSDYRGAILRLAGISGSVTKAITLDDVKSDGIRGIKIVISGNSMPQSGEVVTVAMSISGGSSKTMNVPLTAYMPLVAMQSYPSFSELCATDSFKAVQNDGIELEVSSEGSIQVCAGETVTLTYVLLDGYAVSGGQVSYYDGQSRTTSIDSVNQFTVPLNATQCSVKFYVTQSAGYVNASSSAEFRYGDDYADNYGLHNSIFSQYTVDPDTGFITLTLYGSLYKQVKDPEKEMLNNSEMTFYKYKQELAKERITSSYGFVIDSYTNAQFWIDNGAKSEEDLVYYSSIDRNDNRSGLLIMLNDDVALSDRTIYIGDVKYDAEGEIVSKNLTAVGKLVLKDKNLGRGDVKTVATVGGGESGKGFSVLSEALEYAAIQARESEEEIVVTLTAGIPVSVGCGEVYLIGNYNGANNLISDNVRLVIPSGTTLYVNGALACLGTIDNFGTINVRSIVQCGQLVANEFIEDYVPTINNNKTENATGVINIYEDAVVSNFSVFNNYGKINNYSGQGDDKYTNMANSVYNMANWIILQLQVNSDMVMEKRLPDLSPEKNLVAMYDGEKIDLTIKDAFDELEAIESIYVLEMLYRLGSLINYTVLEYGLVNNATFNNFGEIYNEGIISNGVNLYEAPVFTNSGKITCVGDGTIVNGIVGTAVVQCIYIQIRYLSNSDYSYIGSHLQSEAYLKRLSNIEKYFSPSQLVTILFSVYPDIVKMLEAFEPTQLINEKGAVIELRSTEATDACKFVNYYGKFVNSGSYSGNGALDDLASKAYDFGIAQYYNKVTKMEGVNVDITAQGAQSIDALTVLSGMVLGKTMFDYSSKSVMIATSAYVYYNATTATGIVTDKVAADCITYEAGKATMNVDLSNVEGTIEEIWVVYVFESADGDINAVSSNGQAYYNIPELI